MEEGNPTLVFTIKNDKGQVVKKEFKNPKEGLQRFHWDLRYTLQTPNNYIKTKVEVIFNIDLKQLEEKLVKSGAPYKSGHGQKN